ncbi:MAG: DEAD/DEAH box helicase, partial [Oscillospiraceae bacterium]|nr:DEAD/DEAH box helicase [Oscillospiraceae bacterium]
MAEKISLKAGIETLKGVGAKRAQRFNKLGVDSIYSLLRYYPRTYINFTEYIPIAEATVGELCTVRAKVFRKAPESRIRKGLSLFKVFVTDGESDMVITIFNSKYMYEALQLDTEYIFYGKMGGNFFQKEMNAPTFVPYREKMEMLPIYSLTEGLTNKTVQGAVASALKLSEQSVFDPLPAEVVQKYGLCHFGYAMKQIHLPESVTALEIARKRLIFEELLTLQLGMLILRSRNRNKTGIVLTDTDWQEFEHFLPFSLTSAQKRTINECVSDMKGTVPMNRLVQGDVGSGKTMVAAALGFLLAKNGYQTAIMAPTEILAEQHYKTFSDTFAQTDLRICLLT